ncbi:hypothetical protein SEA_DJUNGELSKOG_21 [Arthrobacter phage Djungelskog]|nr:hypothetical protein SEA_MRAARONIAN_21 [Arthrobacter phage MrAaronian]WNO27626.1 hypothetical protein SEA_DJUNGELSKOG_21 [Arthrobacter phage Djungelskog]
MAKVPVSRQVVNEDNELFWVVVEVDETELREGELPYMPPVTPAAPQDDPNYVPPPEEEPEQEPLFTL